MKDEYDFSEGERGKFFRAGTRLAAQPGMNESLSIVSKARLVELAAMPDSEIDTSEIAEADRPFFEAARLRLPRNDAGK